jgi:homoaconitase/3-isopropylmalate dehydratase large subunit
MKKICSKCNQEKELELFRKQKANKSGYANVCKKCHSDYMTLYYAKNPDKNAEKIRMNTYYKPNWKRHNISEEFYIELFNQYSGMCHSCKENSADNIDHDHVCCSGSHSCGSCVRGLLCHGCNTALGLLKDNPRSIKNLLDYIS